MSERTDRPGPTSRTVEVWRVSLDRSPAERPRLAATLSADEATRARAMRFAVLRSRFVVAHGALRSILATRLGRAPAELELTLDPGGKPRLRRESGEIDLRFSLSHSRDLALVAVAVGREVGVDVERIDERTEIIRLARRYFAPEEVSALEALPAPARRTEFFRCWTLKEAYIKALGVGLRLPLDSFAVSPSAAGPARLVRSDRNDAEAWTLRTLAPAAGFAGAVVAAGRVEVEERRYGDR